LLLKKEYSIVILIIIVLNFSFGELTQYNINTSNNFKELSNDYDYLALAIKCGNWLLNQTLYDPEGYKWPEYQNYTEKNNYTGMNSGSCGIGYFLLELYFQTQNGIYLNYAKNTANWLIFNAIEDNGGVKWEQKENTSNYFTGWSHGAAGIGYYFIKLYYLTSNSTYLQMAIKAGNWLISQAISENSGYKWGWYQNNSRDWIFLPRIISIDFKHNLPPICERRCSVAYKYCHP